MALSSLTVISGSFINSSGRYAYTVTECDKTFACLGCSNPFFRTPTVSGGENYIAGSRDRYQTFSVSLFVGCIPPVVLKSRVLSRCFWISCSSFSNTQCLLNCLVVGPVCKMLSYSPWRPVTCPLMPSLHSSFPLLRPCFPAALLRPA